MERRVFDHLLSAAVKNGASDIHLKPGTSPALRVNGQLIPVKAPALAPEDTLAVARLVLAEARWQGDLSQLKDLDTSYQLDDVGRFRVSLFRAKNHLALVLRAVPPRVPTLEQLGLPQIVRRICGEQRGLVLVTGVTGSGKTSTLAAMVDHMNSTTREHILTIEDPIEFVHVDRLARVTQREIGPDTPDFAIALRSALRQDPDTILVGEMRDLETIEIALKAAETGHLVLSTLHTGDAARTITRLVEVFPHDAHDAVRARLGENLKAIVSQRLVPRADGRGRVPAVEVLVATESVREFIREGRTSDITDYLPRNTDVYGTQSFDQHLTALYRSGVITLETARGASTNRSDFERALSFQ